MQADELKVPGAWVFTPRQFPDPRGVFLEWFKASVLEGAVGHPLTVKQANHSASSRGTLRGVHFADVPPGQAKYVYCTRGAVLDVVVDIRAGSPTFGVSDAVRLDDVDRRGIYLSEGLGHAFLALTDDANVTYLCSEPYNPTGEHGIHPLDPELGLPWPADVEPLLSEKDAAAPTLAQAQESGLLPSYDDCVRFYDRLRTGQ
ncbi:MAG: dTDP-4-keto-6-deoxy-D-glucose epimerase [Frankiales bacterium]|nr:MAG: dTDP-4-keto-6-deoxy-D-glucose epimerase [Frankiales bacterium]